MKIARSFLKDFRLILYTLAIIFILLNTVDAVGPIKFDQNGHWYESLEIINPDVDCHTWIQARDYAANSSFVNPDTNILLQGHLVTIQDADENEWLRITFLPVYGQMWLGAYQVSHDGGLDENWTWITGEEWEYTNWDTTEPGSFDEDYVRMMNWSGHYGKWHDFPNITDSCPYTVIEYEPPIYSCSGFEPPMAEYPVTVRGKNRALPLKAQLIDENGSSVTDADILAPPVSQIIYSSSTNNAEDITGDSLPSGEGTEGNQFVFTDEGKWHFNLKTKTHTAEGTYTIKMVPGDESYTINPTCETSFVRE